MFEPQARTGVAKSLNEACAICTPNHLSDKQMPDEHDVLVEYALSSTN